MLLAKHRLTRALLRQPVDCTPIWIMRQAGRYLPEFKEMRARQPNFMKFCKITDLAVAVTLQPLQRFDLDAAIVFSDILVVPEAMGLELEIQSGVGPIIQHPIRSLADVERLRLPDVNDALGYVMTIISEVVNELNGRIPLIGFAGSPWTCATYMVEGKSSKTFDIIKRMLYCQPEILQALLQKLTDITISYLQAQITAGAEVLMVFDTWGGLLTHLDYQLFSLNYMQKIAKGLQKDFNQKKIPLIFFTKGGGLWLEDIAASGCDAVGLDWTIDLNEAERRVGDQVALQGNMDPALLFSTPSRIEQEVQTILASRSLNTGHVFNLGHGISPQTPVESVQVLVDAVHRYGIVRA